MGVYVSKNIINVSVIFCYKYFYSFQLLKAIFVSLLLFSNNRKTIYDVKEVKQISPNVFDTLSWICYFRICVFRLQWHPQHSFEFSLMALSQESHRSNFKQIVKWPLSEIFGIPAVSRSNCKHITLSPEDYPVIDSKPPRTPIFNSIVPNLS